MRTEDDLRAALTTLEHEAPSAHDVLAPLARSRPPRRPRVLIAVAAGTAAAIALPLAAATLLDRPADNEPAGPAGTRWEYSFTLAPPAGWTLLTENVRRGFQAANLTGPHQSQCIVTSYEAEAFDTGLLSRERKPITVNGHPGVIADVYRFQEKVDKSDPRPHPTLEKIARPVVAWEYAPNAWRLSDCAVFARDEQADRQRLITEATLMADAVTDTARPLRTPVKVGYFPVGWDPRTAASEGPSRSGGQPDFALDAPPVGAPDFPFVSMVRPDARPPDPAPYPDTFQRVSIMYTKGTFAPPMNSTRTTINGLPAWIWKDPKPGTRGTHPPVTAAGIVLRGKGFTITIDSMTTHADYTGELRRVAEQLTIAADPLDESTWFDGAVAIP